ncbi:hypothetical protein NicSoilC12_30510 [Arthrobacter sp. NicSoilC12]|nr:hypothetical protein NicSoilC12_30510 [Arthrobacter sp. NicSoilC12]
MPPASTAADDEWKASPRASRKDDDALWARFRAAQDVFFTNRQAANDEIDQEYGANLVVKEALLVEANELLPIKDLAAAKKSLQSIRDRWEEAGKVPRADMGRIEAGLRKVEDAVRHAEDENWKRPTRRRRRAPTAPSPSSRPLLPASRKIWPRRRRPATSARSRPPGKPSRHARPGWSSSSAQRANSPRHAASKTPVQAPFRLST